MKKILDILLFPFALFLFIGAIWLWDWNVKGTGTWFAIFIVALGTAILVATIRHFYIQYRKKSKK